jgi:ABC-type lipoprotein export system ATPase subunit
VSELLRAAGVAKTFAAGPAPVRALVDVSLDVGRGQTVVVTGPSGAGKTTLLSVLGGLLRCDAGDVRLDGIDLGRADEGTRRRLRAERIGFVFQRGLLLDYLTVRENVALVPRSLGVSEAEAGARADALLARVGMRDRAAVRPAALSAGEAQRAAVARALVMEPDLVLADEPTAHVDAATGAAVVGLLRERVAAGAAALVLVTHDARLVADGDRVVRLQDGTLG